MVPQGLRCGSVGEHLPVNMKSILAPQANEMLSIALPHRTATLTWGTVLVHMLQSGHKSQEMRQLTFMKYRFVGNVCERWTEERKTQCGLSMHTLSLSVEKGWHFDIYCNLMNFEFLSHEISQTQKDKQDITLHLKNINRQFIDGGLEVTKCCRNRAGKLLGNEHSGPCENDGRL